MDNERQVLNLNIDDIIPNRFQPRIKFNEQAINELAESIRRHGVIQPIVVRKISDKYEIIAGERRYKASILAGKTTIPALVTSFDDKNSAEVALMENVQRQDLTPIEEAISYKKILDMGYINQGELGEKLGKKQSTIANKLRLLNLNDEVQEALMENKISERHARSLLRLDDKSQTLMLNRIINERLTVRKADEEINKLLNESGSEKIIKKGENNMNEQEIMNDFNIPTEPIVEEQSSMLKPNPVEEIPNFENINQINTSFTPVEQPISVEDNSSLENIFSDIEPIDNELPIKEKASVEPMATENEKIVPVQTESTIQDVAPINSDVKINPGFMDINKIEEQAQDINPIHEETKPEDIDKLLVPGVQAVMPEVEQAPIVEEQPEVQSGKFFSFGDINANHRNDFVENVEEQKVNMNFEEPKYEPPITPELNPINNATINGFNFENMINSDQDNILNNVDSNQGNDIIQQPIVNSVENIIENSEPESLPVEPVQDNFFDFGTPVSAATLNDNTEFTQQEQETPIIPLEPKYEAIANKSYMMNDDVKFDDDGEIEVKVPTANEKFVTADMKTVINTIRDCAATIEKYGYKIETDEIDLADSYEVSFKIYKD